MKKFHRFLCNVFILTLFIPFISYSQEYKIIESDNDHIILEFNFHNGFVIKDSVIDGAKFSFIKDSKFSLQEPGKPFLPSRYYEVGLPLNSEPQVTIISSDYEIIPDKFIISVPDSADQSLSKLNYDESVYGVDQLYPEQSALVYSTGIYRFIKTASILVSPFQFNPVKRFIVYNKSIKIRIDYKPSDLQYSQVTTVNDKSTESFVKVNLINNKVALNFIGNFQNPLQKTQENFWYNPQKEYFKIYLKKEGVYRLTYNYLLNAGIPVQGLLLNKIQIFNDAKEIPVYVHDTNGNGMFDIDDYCEFVGQPPKASPYSYLNIYNLKNVYWFSYQADNFGLRYKPKDGTPDTWQNSFYTVPCTLHYEVDSLYERLGHADDDHRDYWYWGKTSGLNGELLNSFTTSFPGLVNLNSEATSVKFSANLQGMTTESCLNPDHRIKFFFTSQPIGEFTFDGAASATFETSIDLNQVHIYPDNNLQIAAYGDIPPNPCSPSSSRYDEIRINWFEIEYPRNLRADENNIIFSSPPDINGYIRFQIDNWLRDNIKIFSPQHNEIITNAYFTNGQYNDLLFVDSLSERTKYYCTAEDYFLIPDSLEKNVNSDLRNTSNGSDYIIITHPKFLSAAEKLKNFRLNNFPDSSVTSPRVTVVNIFDIYNEFSSGLLDPNAIKSFISYAFSNWQTPAPVYVVLLGDMSYDYRELIPGDRKNYIPSIPYHAKTYGQAASDNSFVTVKGTDYKPDLAIGRLSCETLDEANVLVDKIINYPGDSGKKWRENVMLISSGLDQDDENLMGFNESNLTLDNNYLKPKGIASNKIFRYPNPTYPEQAQYKGEGPEIREGFNEGAVIANYYGHGGGYQWDLVFNNDDIYQLSNGNKLPFITSVTCYTAHFDNQDVFGEQFNKAPGKGSIAFFGSSGLTYWNIGKYLNEIMFGQIFDENDRIIGKAIQTAKNMLPEGGYYSDQVSLLTLLGDPLLELAIPDKPDFSIVAEDIKVTPATSVINETTVITAIVHNYGIIFPGDTITLQAFISSSDTSYYLQDKTLSNFGDERTVSFNWMPKKPGVYTVLIKVNKVNSISEMDLSDNEASIFTTVYDVSTPSIIKPLDGETVSVSQIDFLFADKGYYLDKNLNYIIEIDTSITFNNPIVESQRLSPEDGLLKWTSPQLNDGNYFWRTRIITESDSSDWSAKFALSINHNSLINGYSISGDHLKLFETKNIVYSDSGKSLYLNTSLLPPRPTNDKYIENTTFALPPDIGSLSTITTDGTYLYFASMSYYSGPGKIYKLGTGYNGTIKGQIYGTISDITLPIWHNIFYYNGFVYVAIGKAHTLVKINLETGDTSSVFIPQGLLNSIDTQVRDGAYYLTSDGRYVYNVAYITPDGANKYTVRVFDPENNWQVIKDLIPTDRSYPNFCGFFVADGYFYPYENYQEGYLRRINLETGFYEEEWISFLPFQGFYAWTYDFINDVVYSSVFSAGHSPKIYKFVGKYRASSGSIVTTSIGPASKWSLVEYEMKTQNTTGSYNAVLQGYNINTKHWDDLVAQLSPQSSPEINVDIYKNLRLSFTLNDSSFGTVKPIELKNVHVDFIPQAEIMITKDNITFVPDTILQGYDVVINSGIQNISSITADSIKLDYYIKAVDFGNKDVFLKTRIVNLAPNSQQTFIDTLQTSNFLLNNAIKLVATYPKKDMFDFNNSEQNIFYVKRDSVRPSFNITFDGKEIVNDDIVSSKPTIQLTLEDNSPLPLSPNMFSITHIFNYNQEVINIPSENINYEYTPFPDSRAVIIWKPTFEDGQHTLIITAKDSSNNYFDSTSYNINFDVYSNPDLRDIYNYPNPFKDDTYFTFELRGVVPPEEFRIKIFTVAGRLIREMNIPQPELRIGFNKILWDGRDQDGDLIANGIYFYKIICKQNNEIRTVTQKLAKAK